LDINQSLLESCPRTSPCLEWPGRPGAQVLAAGRYVQAPAFREASHVTGLDDVFGATVTIVHADGTDSAPVSAAIARPFGQPAEDPVTVRSRIETAATRDPAIAQYDLQFVHGYQDAPLIVVYSWSGLRETDGLLLTSLLGSGHNYEG
jgi:hypothetical protein